MMLLRWNNAASKKMVRSLTIGMTIALTGVMLVNFMGSFLDHRPIEELSYYAVGGFFAALLFLALLAGITRVSYNIRTKAEMANYMLLPATKTEKLVAALLTQIIATACVFIFALILADAMQVIFSLLFTKTVTGSLVVATANSCWAAVENWLQIHGKDLLSTFTSLNMFLNLCAACLLFGCFFRRHQTIWAVAIIVGTPIVLSFALGIVMSFVFFSDSDVDALEGFFDNLSADALIVMYNIVVLAATLFMLWLSNRIYSRTQLMTNRFFNW